MTTWILLSNSADSVCCDLILELKSAELVEVFGAADCGLSGGGVGRCEGPAFVNTLRERPAMVNEDAADESALGRCCFGG